MAESLGNSVVGTVSPGANPSSDSAGRLSFLRVLLLAGVLSGGMVTVYSTPVRAWFQDGDGARRLVAALGFWSYPVVSLAAGLLIACGVPRLALCAVGGMVFWRGLVIVLPGTLLGYYAVFVFVRWGGRAWVTHRFPGLIRWSEMVRRQGVVGVILARQLPIHGTLINLCLGLSHVKHRHFLLGTAIGALPEAVPFTLAGAGLVKGSAGAVGQYLALAAIMLGIVWIACRHALRIMRRNDESGAAKGAT